MLLIARNADEYPVSIVAESVVSWWWITHRGSPVLQLLVGATIVHNFTGGEARWIDRRLRDVHPDVREFEPEMLNRRLKQPPSSPERT